MAASPIKYATYAPGRAPAGKGAEALKLQPGQVLAFAKGRGYYAKPAPVRPGGPAPYAGGGPAEPKSGGGGNPYAPSPPRIPATPPNKTAAHPTPAPPLPPVDPYAALSPGAIDAKAGAIAQGALTPQQAEIRRQQALAADAARNDETALGEFAKAAAGIEGGMAGHLADAYHTAVADQGALGQGISGAVGADLQHAQAAQDDFARVTGQAGAAHGVDPEGVKNTLGMLQSVIPGDALSEQGMANVAQAYRAPQISLAAGAEQIQARMAQARSEGDQYATKLLDLAAQYPDLKAKALDQLNQYEIDKANYRQKVATDRADAIRQDRALADNEVLAGITAKQKQAAIDREYRYKYAALAFKNKQDAAKAAAAAKAGKVIDVGASKLMGHVVYKDGSENPSIKVKQSASSNSPAGKLAKEKYTQTAAAKSTMADTAISLRGTPVLAGKADPTYVGQHGKYVAADKYKAIKHGAGKVFADGTTNNPKRAARTGDQYTYPQVQHLIFEKIGGQAFLARYGYKEAQVMQWIASAMNNAGWSR